MKQFTLRFFNSLMIQCWQVNVSGRIYGVLMCCLVGLNWCQDCRLIWLKAKSTCILWNLNSYLQKRHFWFIELVLIPLCSLAFLINPRIREVWRSFVSKIRSNLAAWHNKNLSNGGRVVLLNSILSNISIFFFSFYKALKVIITKSITLLIVFLWYGVEENKKNN